MTYLSTRRDFIRQSTGLLALGATLPTFLTQAALAAGNTSGSDAPVLVIIQLSGGNDGLNTVVPHGHDAYYRLRPSLAVPANTVAKLNDEIGLHPGLSPLRDLYDRGELAVLQGVGYPNPDRSHFRSMEIWETAEPNELAADGWLGRLFDHACGNGHLTSSPTLAMSLQDTLTPALTGSPGIGIAMTDPDRFHRLARFAGGEAKPTSAVDTDSHLDYIRRTALNAFEAAEDIQRNARRVRNLATYPTSGLAQSLKLVARLIAGGQDTRLYYLSLGGFDTHARQAGTHEQLLATLGGAIAAFQQDLRKLGLAERVVGMTFSEFGRRVAENGSQGTDHGQAAPLFVFGQSVKGGIHGAHPSFDKLANGDLRYHTDFRRLYATMIDQWLRLNSKPVLGGTYEPLALLT